MIDHKDFMHGAALVAIADSEKFTALNRASVRHRRILDHQGRGSPGQAAPDFRAEGTVAADLPRILPGAHPGLVSPRDP
ncbi:hypothetical protein [Streptomyces albogriseolus]|uniref:hypothetical protein n=1 Tax=Streptomyces albogriseolus TaxID=1887 RepID=UPI0034600B90